MRPCTRLVKHTLAATVLFGSSVLAPLLLLTRQQLGTAATVLGVGLLAAGGSSLLGAGLSLTAPLAREERRWTCLVAAVWVFNPCLVLLVGECLHFAPAIWLSCLPLALALSILCTCVPQAQEAPPTTESSSGVSPTRSRTPTRAQAARDVELEAWPGSREADAGDSDLSDSEDEESDEEDEREHEAGAEAADNRRQWVEMEVRGDEQAREVRPRPSVFVALRRALSRVVLVGAAMTVLSFQLGLYAVPSEGMPGLAEAGTVACGACALMFAKLYGTCASLGQQRFSQACMLTTLMLADWISFAQVRGRDDGTKQVMLLSLLLLVGVCQSVRAFARLKLRPRWARALEIRRAQARARNDDSELGAPMVPAVPRRVDSSDSDDEEGPGSLPEGFHGALAGVLGISQTGAALGSREWLCGACSAFVVLGAASAPPQGDRAVVPSDADARHASSGDASPAAGAEAAAELAVAPAQQQVHGAGSSSPSGSPPEISLEIAEGDRLCVVCQEDIQTGEQVRPLPKCGHKFHASCLERWAAVQGEATRCPTCRRPALMRRHGRGAVSVAALMAAAAEREAREAERGLRAPPMLRMTGRRLATRSALRWALLEGTMRPEVFEALDEDEEDEDAVLQGWRPSEAQPEESSPESGEAAATTANAAAVAAAAAENATAARQRRSRTQEFEVTIEKDGVELGLDVLQHDWETLLITRIKDGPLRQWNQRNPQRGIRHGDRIIEVNGQRGDSEVLISTIRAERSLRIVVRRLVEFCVVVQRPNGQRLGVDVTQHPRSLRVLQVSEGPFRRWNAGVNFDFQVQPADHIVEVNGVHGTSAQLLQEIQATARDDSSARVLHLVLVRRRPSCTDQPPSPPASAPPGPPPPEPAAEGAAAPPPREEAAAAAQAPPPDLLEAVAAAEPEPRQAEAAAPHAMPGQPAAVVQVELQPLAAAPEHPSAAPPHSAAVGSKRPEAPGAVRRPSLEQPAAEAQSQQQSPAAAQGLEQPAAAPQVELQPVAAAPEHASAAPPHSAATAPSKQPEAPAAVRRPALEQPAAEVQLQQQQQQPPAAAAAAASEQPAGVAPPSAARAQPPSPELAASAAAAAAAGERPAAAALPPELARRPSSELPAAEAQLQQPLLPAAAPFEQRRPSSEFPAAEAQVQQPLPAAAPFEQPPTAAAATSEQPAAPAAALEQQALSPEPTVAAPPEQLAFGVEAQAPVEAQPQPPAPAPAPAEEEPAAEPRLPGGPRPRRPEPRRPEEAPGAAEEAPGGEGLPVGASAGPGLG